MTLVILNSPVYNWGMYEYMVIQTKEPPSKEKLNEFSEEGWALVTVVSSDYYLAGVFFSYWGRVKKQTWTDEAYATLRRHALEDTP